MRVLRAKTAGFCMGVSLALRKLDGAVQQGGNIATLGPIIHNPQVLSQYEELGVCCYSSPGEATAGDTVIIRAHGVPRDVEEELGARTDGILDATCPKVKRAQLGIARNLKEGGTLLLYGEKDHPEVRGLLSYAGESTFVFGSFEELQAYPFEEGKHYVLAAQTTQDRNVFSKIVEWIKDRLGEETSILETICDATRERQLEVITLTQDVDVMVVVGGYNSGNTRRLAEVSIAQGCETYHIELPEELPCEALRGKQVAGLTAGASTPAALIDATQKLLESL